MEGEVRRHKPLTEPLKDSNSPVTGFLKQRFPRTASLTQEANLQLQSEDTINPGFKPKIYDLLATAIGYRIRYSFAITPSRSEEHTSELQSQSNLVCRL